MSAEVNLPPKKPFFPSWSELRANQWRCVAALLGILFSIMSLLYWTEIEEQRKRTLIEKGRFLLETEDDLPASIVSSQPSETGVFEAFPADLNEAAGP